MKKALSTRAAAILFSAALTGAAFAQSIGPDVIVGDLSDFDEYPPFNGLSAFAVGTTSCNIGNRVLLWEADNNRHPVIAQNLYRWKMLNGSGRYEHIGQSHLKHGFTALTQSLCAPCTNTDNTGATLDPNCSDPYVASLNGSQGRLGPRNQVNAFTGAYAYPFSGQGTGIPSIANGGDIWRRLQVRTSEVQPAGNTGAIFIAEGHYIASDDAAAGNALNNSSYRRVTVTGVAGALTMAAATNYPTQRQLPAIYGWQTCESGVTIRPVAVQGEGQFNLAFKVTPLVNGLYHYEYMLHNLNSDRSASSFSIDFTGSGISDFTTHQNVGFRDVDYHSGEPFNGTDWVAARNATGFRWNTTQTFAQNANANALRWSTSYSFRFDSDMPPVDGTATIGLFKPGTPANVVVSGVKVPASSPCIADFDINGGVDGDDVATFLTAWTASESTADTNRDGGVDGQDVEMFFTHWVSGC